MSAESSTLTLHQPSDYRAILWGGLGAGILDISAAIINTAIRNGRGPVAVFQTDRHGNIWARTLTKAVLPARPSAPPYISLSPL